MIGELLPDADHVARYCKPSTVDNTGVPTAAAFKPRSGEDYLSVNWLEYSGAPTTAVAVQHVRDAFHNKGYRLRSSGRFAVLNVGTARDHVSEALGKQLRIDHQPLDDDPSHAGIHDYGADDLAVAVELKSLVDRHDIHPAGTA